ncbi:histidine phosphatase family protein [Nocardioides sp. DS6]|uniref:Histidine phosphatase family protein n=1 Tax=Nocardioides eburneus TaxID=3231482 RepID=A0ABV3T3Z1_9ACTN
MGLYLVRHGATEWSISGRHTSTTDLPLLAEGEQAAKELAPRLSGTEFAAVLTSPRLRARRTAELAGFPDAIVDPDLAEWDYGDYEGVTTEEIRRTDPGWTIWDGVTPRGETAAEVSARLDRVVAAAREREGDTLVFAHGHSLRVLAARWLGQPASYGRNFWLGTATLSVLGEDRGQPVVVHWNS